VDWSDDGQSFVIKSQARFETEVIQSVYGHQSLKNFVRQLHKYGFNKVRSKSQLSMKSNIERNDECQRNKVGPFPPSLSDDLVFDTHIG
jgi:hypothetical protein